MIERLIEINDVELVVRFDVAENRAFITSIKLDGGKDELLPLLSGSRIYKKIREKILYEADEIMRFWKDYESFY